MSSDTLYIISQRRNKNPNESVLIQCELINILSTNKSDKIATNMHHHSPQTRQSLPSNLKSKFVCFDSEIMISYLHPEQARHV